VSMPAGANTVLSRVGSLVEGPAFYSQLSGKANLARYDAADRTADPRTAEARISAALDRVGLLSAARKHYRAYSLGMKQRLAIAAGLLGPRELLILDEPTNGLDPQGTREVRGLIREIAADGTTVFVSSHLLAEVEQICSHVGVMRTGKLVFQGTLEQLRGRGATRILVRTAQPARAAEVLAGLGLQDVQAGQDEASAQLGGSRRRRSARSSCTPASRWPGSPPRGPAWRTCSSSSPARASMSTAEATGPAAEVTGPAGRRLTADGGTHRARHLTGARLDPVRQPGYRAGPVIHWIRFLCSELSLIFLRWRNLALLAVLAAIPVLIGVALKLSASPAGGGSGQGPAFLGQVAGNGVFLALLSLTVLLTLVLPLVVAVVAGDSVAGEAGHGTLRYLLAIPAGRTRLLGIKYAAVVIFCLAACGVVTAASLAWARRCSRSGR
jgi:ABC-type multidrug transport system ATPase subunit